MDVQDWLQNCIDEMKEVSRTAAHDQEGLEERARAYSFGTAGWLQTAGSPPDRDDTDPRSVLAHDCALIPVKIYRAVSGVDDGSAKIALVAIDRSRGAWLEVVARRLAAVGDVELFVSELGFLAGEIERMFPHARAFATE
jgi:hypothetical protein